MPLPVIIVGAGPCGLVAAMALKKRAAPFKIIEKCRRDKICSNVGAGFELASTALGILRNDLEVPIMSVADEYGGAVIMTMDGEVVRDQSTVDKSGKSITTTAAVNRDDLQKMLLEKLFPHAEDEKDVLLCSTGFESYEEDTVNGIVCVKLQGVETPLEGCALLGCDGIHSKVRMVMNKDLDDPLNFCKSLCYWGKCPVVEDSPLEKVIDRHQNYKQDGPSVLVAIGTKYTEGGFYMTPINGQNVWAIFLPADAPPVDTTSDDSVRRGGYKLSEKKKQELLERFPRDFPLMKGLVSHTPAEDITEVGLFDRGNLDLCYSSAGKLVAILGDAAHPQTPHKGQGVNMAIVDGYVCATRIANSILSDSKGNVSEAIVLYDSQGRRKKSNEVILASRQMALQATTNWLICWLLRMVLKYIPLKWLIGEVESIDTLNKDFVRELSTD